SSLQKWKWIWSVVYGGSGSSSARMEYSYKVGTAGGCLEQKTVLRLRNCIRVRKANATSCPEGWAPFLVETDEKLFVFAAWVSELEDWIRTLCETAFPVRVLFCHLRLALTHSQLTGFTLVMFSHECSFRVTAKDTEASKRCGLRGTYIITLGGQGLELRQSKAAKVVFMWPYHFLRNFGLKRSTFQFEAGRRCDSGEGVFKFECNRSRSLFEALHGAIMKRKNSACNQSDAEGGEWCGGARRASMDLVRRPEAESPLLGNLKRLSLDGALLLGSKLEDASSEPRAMSLPGVVASEIYTNPKPKGIPWRTMANWNSGVESDGSLPPPPTPDCIYATVKKELLKKKPPRRNCGAGGQAEDPLPSHAVPQELRDGDLNLQAMRGSPKHQRTQPQVDDPKVLCSAAPPTGHEEDSSARFAEETIYGNVY
ncbi:docking protein 2, partial [Arapaima gigas]